MRVLRDVRDIALEMGLALVGLSPNAPHLIAGSFLRARQMFVLIFDCTSDRLVVDGFLSTFPSSTVKLFVGKEQLKYKLFQVARTEARDTPCLARDLVTTQSMLEGPVGRATFADPRLQIDDALGIHVADDEREVATVTFHEHGERISADRLRVASAAALTVGSALAFGKDRMVEVLLKEVGATRAQARIAIDRAIAPHGATRSYLVETHRRSIETIRSHRKEFDAKNAAKSAGYDGERIRMELKTFVDGRVRELTRYHR